MTFSQEAKNEVLKSVKNVKGCCASSFLTAVLKAIGSLKLERRKFCFTVEYPDDSEICFIIFLPRTGENKQVSP